MSIYSTARQLANSSRTVQRILNKKRERGKKQAIEHFQKYGYDVQRTVHDILKDSPFQYFALTGTLLGVVREGGFIPYDDDLDYGIMIDDDQKWDSFRCLMVEKGFNLKHYYTEENAITEMAFEYKGIGLDFFGMRDCGDHLLSSVYYRRKNKKYEYDEVSTMHISYPPFLGTREVICHDCAFLIPVNSEGFLVCNYGENWRIPDRSFGLETKQGTRTYFDDKISKIHRN